MENDERELLEFLIEMGRLDGPSEGITRQVLAKGEESLSDRQQAVFERHVKEVYCSIECEICHCEVPLGEYARWEDDGRLCYSCASRMAKDERELRRQ